MSPRFSISARARSFRFAIRGVVLVLASQHNAWIHALATILVVVGGICFHITRAEWGAVILASAAVWIAEALNTAIEFLADATRKEQDPLIGKAKDVAAGGVLIAAIAAVLVATMVFGPYLMLAIRN